MAYSKTLLLRIRAALACRDDVAEQPMFGGIAFMVKGNMACGPHGDELIVRIGDEAVAAALKEPHVKPMAFTGRAMRSFAQIEAAGIKTDAQLQRWVSMAADYAASLKPRRAAKAKRDGGRDGETKVVDTSVRSRSDNSRRLSDDPSR